MRPRVPDSTPRPTYSPALLTNRELLEHSCRSPSRPWPTRGGRRSISSSQVLARSPRDRGAHFVRPTSPSSHPSQRNTKAPILSASSALWDGTELKRWYHSLIPYLAISRAIIWDSATGMWNMLPPENGSLPTSRLAVVGTETTKPIYWKTESRAHAKISRTTRPYTSVSR